MPTITEVIIETIKKPYISYGLKELLIGKLEDAPSLKDAYLTDEEKEVVNFILRSKGIPFQVA